MSIVFCDQHQIEELSTTQKCTTKEMILAPLEPRGWQAWKHPDRESSKAPGKKMKFLKNHKTASEGGHTGYRLNEVFIRVTGTIWSKVKSRSIQIADESSGPHDNKSE